MRTIIALLLFAGLAAAQGPRVGIVDFYGARQTSPAELRKLVNVKPGDPLPASKGDVEDRLEKSSTIVQALLTATCCADDGGAILYVGLEEKGAPHFNYHAEPDGDAQLPDDVGRAYVKFLNTAADAARSGQVAEDLTHGHSLMSYPAARDIQETFVGLADEHLPTLRKVLREGAGAEQRAMAAYVIGYASRKTAIIDDLLYALQDPDETVRGNAMRSLGALAVLGRTNADSGVRISPTWIVEMLNSLSWTDRHNAAVTLVTLTEGRDNATLQMIHERGLQSLVDMAKWQHLPHALPGFILLGRMAGISEQELQKTWSEGRRDALIRRITARGKR